MSTAKPNQSSAQPDASDDLIAELARMMAQEAQGTPERSAPSHSAVAAPVPTAAPAKGPELRSSGAEIAPKAELPPRIPGQLPQQPATGTSARFDFGRPPAATPIRSPEPLASWQDRLNARKEQQARAAQERQEPRIPPSEAEPAPPSPAPSLSALAQAEPKMPAPAAAPRDLDLDFDFGIGSKAETQADAEPASAPEPAGGLSQVRMPLQEAAGASDDAIANLIAAEFESSARPERPPVQSQQPRTQSAANQPVRIPEPPAQMRSPVVSQDNTARREPSADQFAVAPVFGIGSKPSQPAAPVDAPISENPATKAPQVRSVAEAPSVRTEPAPAARPEAAYSDPFAEIEMLVGDTIRKDRQPERKQPEAKPANPFKSVATPVPLRKAEPKRASKHDPAEDAILAAAAVSGARVENYDEMEGEEAVEPTPRRGGSAREQGRRRNLKPILAPLVAGTLLVAAGAGAYWGLGMGQGDSVAPVLTADTAPIKQAPAEPVAEAEPEPRSVVMDEIDGAAPTAETEQLVSRDQTEGAQVADVTPTVTPQAETGLVNRKVRTVTVRPDGTIISTGEGSLAGASALPVARPNVPELPTTGVDATDLLAGSTAQDEPLSATAESSINALIDAETAPEAEVPPAAATSSPAGDPLAAVPPAAESMVPPAAESTVPPAAPATNLGPLDPSAPIPMPRPANRASLTAPAAPPPTLVGDLGTSMPMQALAVPQSSDAQPAVAVEAAPSAAAYVQLSSQRSQADAQASLSSIQGRWGSLFRGVPLEIKQIDLADRGTYYRVLLPASSLQEANRICADVKAQGGDCFALN